jgi:hypothetical protein
MSLTPWSAGSVCIGQLERVLLVDVVVGVADERRREVEAEPVDAHLGDPVAQRVQHQPLHAGLARVDELPVPVTS